MTSGRNVSCVQQWLSAYAADWDCRFTDPFQAIEAGLRADFTLEEVGLIDLELRNKPPTQDELVGWLNYVINDASEYANVLNRIRQTIAVVMADKAGPPPAVG